MIQILEYILMGIGGLTVVYWLYKFPSVAGTALEAGFRDRFPLDYQAGLSEFVDFFREWGYEQKDFLDPGSDKPGINLVKGENEIEIYLDTPLDENSKSEIEIVFKRQSIKIRTPKMTDECKMLLSEALKIYEHNNHSPAAV